MKEQLKILPPFDRLWQNTDPFAAADELAGEEYRRVKSRRTFRFEVEGRGYFAKIHRGVGWREIWKNLLQGKAPVLGAGNEFRAVTLLTGLGVDTMTVAAYGERGRNPARRQSFLITEELAGMESLEDHCRRWREQPPAFRHKRALLAALARTARLMHENGLNHRDCYLCHFLLDLARWDGGNGPAHLHVIDLHRSQLRRQVPYRYLVKDVAGLYFSSLDAGLTRNDCRRFIALYRGKPWRECMAGEAGFWRDVERTAYKLYAKEFGRTPPAPR